MSGKYGQIQHCRSSQGLIRQAAGLAELRQALRQRRRALSNQEQQEHGLAISGQLLAHPWLGHCRNLALYLATDGEVDLMPLVTVLAETPIRCHLPILKPNNQKQLWFAPWHPGDPLKPNRFGIAEPDIKRQPPLPTHQLDIILMPLVGFDEKLNRLGMGGGYYDRSLAFVRTTQGPRPHLIGIAHECQRVSALSPAPWDIPMDAVITELGIYQGQPKSRSFILQAKV